MSGSLVDQVDRALSLKHWSSALLPARRMRHGQRRNLPARLLPSTSPTPQGRAKSCTLRGKKGGDFSPAPIGDVTAKSVGVIWGRKSGPDNYYFNHLTKTPSLVLV